MRYTIGEMAEIIDGDRGKNYPHQHEFLDEGYCLFLNTGNVTKAFHLILISLYQRKNVICCARENYSGMILYIQREALSVMRRIIAILFRMNMFV